MPSLDEIDLKILSFLDKNARISMSDVAKELGISRQLATIRLQRMETSGHILGHFTIFDSGILGFNWYRVFFRFLSISKAERITFIEFLKKHKNVVWLGEVGGRWDVVASFSCEGHIAFNQIFEEISEKFGVYVKETQILVYVDIFDFSRSNLNQNDGSRISMYHGMAANPTISLDALDKKIIANISTNARMPFSELSKKIGASRLTIKGRVEKMMRKKIILGFRTFPKLSAIGYQSHMVFLQINKMNKERETELYYYLKMIKQVTFVVKHLESWRIGLEIETKSEREFQDVCLDIRSHFSDLISDYDSFPLLQDYVVNYFPNVDMQKN